MTEAEWLACEDSDVMVRYLIGTNESPLFIESFPDCRGSDRKLRLFACTCYHRLGHLLPDADARGAIRVAEQVADGTATVSELHGVRSEVKRLYDNLEPTWQMPEGAERTALHARWVALSFADSVCSSPQKAAYMANSYDKEIPNLTKPPRGHRQPTHWELVCACKRAHCQFLRDIFGNPFRPITFSPEWRTDTAFTLARQMYDAREFSAMPILADALQDAGCDSDDILNHCRDVNQVHVRGCWVVDLVLGKE